MRFLQRLFGGHAARRIYGEASEASSRSAAALARSTDPFDRMFALLDRAECELTMSQNAYGFRLADVRDHDGRMPAEVHELSATLLGWVAATEAKLAELPGLAANTCPPLDHIVTADVQELLGYLGREPRPAVRGALVLTLHDAVVGRTGQDAAAVLAVLAANYFDLAGMSRMAIVARVWPTTPDGRGGRGGRRWGGGGDVVSG